MYKKNAQEYTEGGLVKPLAPVYLYGSPNGQNGPTWKTNTVGFAVTRLPVRKGINGEEEGGIFSYRPYRERKLLGKERNRERKARRTPSAVPQGIRVSFLKSRKRLLNHFDDQGGREIWVGGGEPMPFGPPEEVWKKKKKKKTPGGGF